MAAYDIRTVLDTAGDLDKAPFGGGPPKWDGKGRTYDYVTPSIDCKAYNDASPAASDLKAADQIDLIDLRKDTLITAYMVEVETAGGAGSGNITLRQGTGAVSAAINANVVGVTRVQPLNPTLITADVKLNVLLSAAPGTLKFRVWCQFADISSDR